MDHKVLYPELETTDDVRAWFNALLDAGVSFHPEESFLDIVEFSSGAATFSPTEAIRMDQAMARAYDIVDDPSEIAFDVILNWRKQS